jgi:hypothetical protein
MVAIIELNDRIMIFFRLYFNLEKHIEIKRNTKKFKKLIQKV